MKKGFKFSESMAVIIPAIIGVVFITFAGYRANNFFKEEEKERLAASIAANIREPVRVTKTFVISQYRDHCIHSMKESQFAGDVEIGVKSKLRDIKLGLEDDVYYHLAANYRDKREGIAGYIIIADLKHRGCFYIKTKEL